MSTPKLCLYEFDRDALRAFSSELKTVLRENDHQGLIALLQLGAPDFEESERLVDRFLRPETDPRSRVLFASIRRISKRRALTLAFSSQDPSLEDHLRSNEVLRGNPLVSPSIDNLLRPSRLPWYLRRKNSTGGWLKNAARQRLATALSTLASDLPREVVRFAEALEELDGDVIAHDNL